MSRETFRIAQGVSVVLRISNRPHGTDKLFVVNTLDRVPLTGRG